jgi:predicted PurR-regulated permease PerM
MNTVQQDKTPTVVVNHADTVGDASQGWLSRERTLALVLVAATVVMVYLCYRLIQPFFPALAWALALAVIARPLHARVLAAVPYPSLAAGLTAALVTLVIVLPAVFVVQHLVGELSNRVEAVQEGANPSLWLEKLRPLPGADYTITWIQENVDVDAEVRRAAGALLGSAPSAILFSGQAVVQGLITIFCLFYFLRDRHQALPALRRLLPLNHTEEDRLFKRVADSIHATIYGSLTVALIQGAMGGFMFWVLGLPAPVLWGTVMGLLAVIPNLGTFVIWAPVALYLALNGEWNKALLLAGWGAIAIGLIDNFLYPFLVGNRLRMHTLTAFFAILGGLAVFGASGLILGPVIVAVALALLDVWRWRTADGGTAEEGVHEEPHLVSPGWSVQVRPER